MATINELNQEQQELLARLYWEEEGSEEDGIIKIKLSEIKLSVEAKLKFLSGILREAKDLTEARQEAAKRAQARAKSAENVENRLNEFIKQTMEDFGIKKVSGDLCNITYCDGRESIELIGSEKKSITYEAGYDCLNLPDDCYEAFTVLRPIADKIKEHLRDGEYIKDATIVKKPYLLVK